MFLILNKSHALSCCATTFRPGMNRYVSWQNTLLAPSALRKFRFVEIPSLMQTGLFTKSAVLTATAVRSLIATTVFDSIETTVSIFRADKGNSAMTNDGPSIHTSGLTSSPRISHVGSCQIHRCFSGASTLASKHEVMDACRSPTYVAANASI